jgi:competence protein ComFC
MNCRAEDGPKLGEKLLRLLYPVKCVFCGSILPESAHIAACKKCRAILPRYGASFERVPGIPYLDGLMAAYIYEDEIEQAVKAMKFSHRPGYAETLAMLLAENIRNQENMPDFDVIVPVPMHKRKKAKRGYNQSELLARHMGRFLDIPVENLLVKTCNTKAQSLLGREERLRNLEGTIAVADGAGGVTGLNILLVDDVTTTGTTLNTCARALYEAGASFIFGSVIAIAGK